MRLRPPSVPLITVDPYFSLWSPADRLTDTETRHWTNRPMVLNGIADIDGQPYRFIGTASADTIPAMKQISVEVEAFTTTYVFQAADVELTVLFTTPILPTNLYLISRPVSYMEVIARGLEESQHTVTIRVSASEQFCLHEAGQDDVTGARVELTDSSLSCVRMGSVSQPILHCSGDDRRIDWGYLYLTVRDGQTAFIPRTESGDGMAYLQAEVTMVLPEDDAALFAFAYDDIDSIQYFGQPLKAYWKSKCPSIDAAIVEAFGDYLDVADACKAFSDQLFCDATRAGGEKYAELLLLAIRQSIGAHKLVLDENGEILFVSKENFSNGCACTVDVSYPSIPLFLLYQPELVHGMMRPVYRYAASSAWKFDFAPHDVGQYPLVNGQVYGDDLYRQMPVEECGNMLIMEATSMLASGDATFAASHLPVLERWVDYLIANGDDPQNQLCTDDFAGHMAHNCNLTIKAIMGILSLSLIKEQIGQTEDSQKYLAIAKEKAAHFTERARNADGSYRLAFDREGTFSLKYNLIWDRLFGTELFPQWLGEAEIMRYIRERFAYGTPLDSRKTYTKSDWLVWAASLATTREDFEVIVDPLWRYYHETPARVPMTDWYDTVTAAQCGFQCRTVIGGLFIRLLAYKGYLKIHP